MKNSSKSGFIGFVTAYQSLRRFTVIGWPKQGEEYNIQSPFVAGGVQIQVPYQEQLVLCIHT